MTNILKREDGTEITSSSIFSLRYTEQTNTTENFKLGTCVASEIEVSALGSTPVSEGERLEYYRVFDETEYLVGVFYAHDIEVTGRNQYSFVGYDTISKLDVVVDEWLYDNKETFPMSAKDLMSALCTKCGVTFATTEFENDDYSISYFNVDGITARDIVGYISEIAGTFVKANSSGEIIFDWYKANNNVVINCYPSETETRTAIPYYQGTLSFNSNGFQVPDQVVIKRTDTDIGVVYPDGESFTNKFDVNSTPIMNDGTTETLTPIAQTIYTVLQGMANTPCEVKIIKTPLIHAGDIIELVTPSNESKTFVVEKLEQDASGMYLSSWGTSTSTTPSAVRNKSYTDLRGKFFEWDMDISGLRTKAGELEGSYTELKQTVDGLSVEVSQAVSGGSNLVKNSSGLNEMNSWTHSADFVTEDTASTTSGKLIVLNANTISQAISLVEGQTYTFSARVKNEGTTVNISMNFGSASETLHTSSTSGDWQTVTSTFTAQGSSENLIIEVIGSRVLIGDIMISEGTMQTSWTCANDEIYTTNVKIDATGISITNSDSKTETKIDNTQFAVKHNDEVVLTVNKDETILQRTNVKKNLVIGNGMFSVNSEGLDFVILG